MFNSDEISHIPSEGRKLSSGRNILQETSFYAKRGSECSVFNLPEVSIMRHKAKKYKKGCSFRKLLSQRELNNDSYVEMIKLRQITKYELIESYADIYPLLELRLAILRCKYAFSEFCIIIISHKLFEYFIIFIILANTFTLALSDPYSNSSTVFNNLDFIFLQIYTVEMSLKIGANGIGLMKSGYLRDYWNILDFFIVVTGWVAYVGSADVNINSLRTLRILRPLRGISSISGLRVLFVALLGSVQQLLASLFLLLVFLIIFSIAGLQLWSGLLKHQCMNIETGVLSGELCGDFVCPTQYECAKSLDNPHFGATSFDNLPISFLIVFQCVTLEGWTDVLFAVQKAFSRYSFIYFVVLAFIGAYMLVNLTLAVIKGAFTVAMNEVREKESNQKILEEIVHSQEIAKQLKGAREYRNGALSEYDLSENSDLNSAENLETGINKNSGFTVRSRPLGAFIGQSNTSIERQKSSIGNTIIKRATNNYQRQISHVYDVESAHSITPHLISMNSSLKVNKSLLSNLSSTKKTHDIKVQILAREMVRSYSEDDVMPKKRGYDLLDTLSFKTEYKFRYRLNSEQLYGMDCIEDQVLEKFEDIKGSERRKVFKKFCEEQLKAGAKAAFFLVKVRVREFIKVIKERDNITKNIIALHSEVDLEKPIKKKVLIASSNYNYRLWSSGCLGAFQKFKTPIMALVSSKYFTLFISLIVLANIVTLSLNRYGMPVSQEKILSLMNYSFTIIFTIEMGLKIVGLGLTQYLRDKMNYFDSVITLLSLIELVFISKDGSAISAFRGVRVFRLIRVVRIVRLFRYLKSMAHIFQVISKSISKFIYLALFLLLLIVIYSLLGMRIFANSFDSSISRSNFDTFNSAFITIFQIMTLENWQNVMYAAMNSSAGPASCLYLVSWIFIGNYVVLNLFLAILLDAFSETEDDSISVITEENDEDINNNNKRTSLYGNYQERINKKREANLLRIQEIPDQDSDFEIDHLNSIAKMEKIYDEVLCIKSFGLFSKENALRRWCLRLSTNTKFENFILCIITISSIKLVIDTYLTNSDSEISTYVDAGITFAFALECIIKSISFGFCMSTGSYLRDWWNSIDFLIVVISIIDFAVSSISIKYIKVFRLLRTLRPLRFISHNLSMKIIVKALLESIVAIVNVVVVCMIVWLMFAILGVSLFGGKLYNCSLAELTTMDECIKSGFTWKEIYPNYDNIINAMVTLFILSSLEGWPDIMYAGVDAKDIEQAPVKNYNPYAAYYFVTFVFIGSLFFLNFFIGVIFEKFNEAKRNETDLSALILNKDQVIWVEMQRLVVNSKLKLENVQNKASKIQAGLYKIAKSSAFTYFILACIVLNMVQMAIYYDGASATYIKILEYLNLTFTIIFILEAIIKLSGLGIKEYFKSNWNKFDFFVVTTSIIDLFMEYFINSRISLLRIGPQLIRIIKVLRVSRFVRLFNFLKPLQNLLTIMTYSLPAIMNVLSLLILLFFIYAVLGVYLFGGINNVGEIDEYTNFDNFGMAMITLFRCSTGENWYAIMQTFYSSQGIILSNAYFMSFITISTFVMFNLFIMVILQNYDDYMSNPDSLIKNFTNNFKEIKLAWTNHCEKETIHFKNLRPIMYDLRSDLGVPIDTNFEKLSRILASLNLDVDSNGQVYFKDFLFCILRRKYGKKMKMNANSKKLILKEEQNTRKKLKKLKLKLENKTRKKTLRKSRIGIEEGNRNYFMEMMSAKIVFKAWRGYAQKRRERGSDYFSLSITPRDSDEEHPGINSLSSLRLG